METKKWYLSKTMWANAVAGLAVIIQGITGSTWINPEAQVGLLALINIVLRIVTKSGIE